jgi:hypothetical protein
MKVFPFYFKNRTSPALSIPLFQQPNVPNLGTHKALPEVAPDTNLGMIMMKKILNLVFLIAMLAMPMLLTSCGDDSDEPLSDGDVTLLMGGTWQFEKADVIVLGQKIEMSYKDILKYMKEQAGTDKIVVLDEKLSFTDKEMIYVNVNKKVPYRYYSNGKFWCEGMDDIVGMVINMSIHRLTQNQLVFRYKVSLSGLSISFDLYYSR